MENQENYRCGFIALIGRPNVGKSTLLNKLIGEKLAAVSPKAQTTRRRFRGIRTDADSQMIFVDTPGVHVAPQGKKLNEYCVSEALDVLADADAFVYIIDGSRAFEPTRVESDEAFLLGSLEKILQNRKVPLFLVINKVDHQHPQGPTQAVLEKEMLTRLPVTALLPMSARTGAGVDALVAALKEVLPVGPALFPEDELTDQNMRTIVGELIQEKLFLLLGEEIPYSCAVEITAFREVSEARRYPEIEAAIHVERDSQKAVVVGKGGAKIKEIGIRARETIERLMGTKVVLKLFVKHTPQWTKDANELKRLGYIVPEQRAKQ